MPAAVGELEAIIARTALKYDLLPYESKPFPQSQPARLGGLAKLFGLEAAPLENARVLELGCASGGNLIPHAVRYPGATFVGVDLARSHVAAGRARIERLGLTNAEILCQSFTEIGEDLGAFDYIICHGVHSWVPPQVQDHILKVIGARLSPVGVACVSYNVLPGWRMLQPMRDAFMAALPEDVDMLARVANARKLLEFLAETTPDTGPYGDTLRAWAKRFPNLPDDYIAHDFLEECNNPVMVSQFAASATQHGLGFLAECELQAMILDNYEAKVAEGIRARGGNDLVASEQMLDWLTGRTFRQTLLVSRERMASINRALTADSLAGLHFVLPNGAKVERDGDKTSLSLPNGRSINSGNAEVGAMLDAMVLAMPGSSAHDDLLGTAQGETRAALSEALYRMVITGMVQVASEADVCLNSASEKPLASALVRSDVEAGAATTTNLRHEPLSIDPAARIALPMLDGENGRKAIVTKLIKEAKAGKITYAKDGAEITDPAKLKAVVEEHLEGMLTNLAAAALLEA